MANPDTDLSPADEAARLLSWHGGIANISACMNTLSQQFQVLQSRSQLLLTLSTLTLTITGFSGPKIAQTNALARYSIAVGIVFVLISTILVLIGTLRIKWVSQFTGKDEQSMLEAIIAYRNRKTRLYRWELGLLVIGLTCYVCSVVTYLVSLS
jgi:hypothetical protein